MALWPFYHSDIFQPLYRIWQALASSRNPDLNKEAQSGIERSSLTLDWLPQSSGAARHSSSKQPADCYVKAQPNDLRHAMRGA
jgi:hypothetical protein